MSDELDDLLGARFARQDDPAFVALPGFADVRSRAAMMERARKRRRLMLVVAIVAALVAVPGIALSRTLIDRVFGQPVDPSLRDYIGQVIDQVPGSSFTTPPRYVAGVQTSRGLVLLWAARRGDGSECTGLEAAFGGAATVPAKLARRPVADNGVSCGGGAERLDSTNAGLTTGQALGTMHVSFGHVPARMHALRVTFEDGRTQVVPAERGWVVVAFERDTERPGHRPILEQALGASGRVLATTRLDPWNYGGKEPAPPPLEGSGSRLLTALRTPGGRAELRLSARGLRWERQQCFGIVIGHRQSRVECSYPAASDPRVPTPQTNDLYLYGSRVPGLVVAIARNIDQAWLVFSDRSVRPVTITRFGLAGAPHVVIVAPTGRGLATLGGIVTSRDRRIVGALLLATRDGEVPGEATPPCFLAGKPGNGNGVPPTGAACRELIAEARRSAAVAP